MIDQTLSGRYHILQNLSKGGMGQTYVAEDTQRPGHPKCVVKQLKIAKSNPNFLATARRLFEREAQILEQLGNHPQIPRLLAHFEEDNDFYLVQELIEGHPLNTEIVQGNRWSEVQVNQFLQEILKILDFVHQQGVIHRDIKPDNLIRCSDGQLVLIDFGIVAQLSPPSPIGASSTEPPNHGYTPPTQVVNEGAYQATKPLNEQQRSHKTTMAIGTLGYMPPEQMSSKPYFSSDLYAVGMTAIQALTGVPPDQLEKDEDGEVIWRHLTVISEGLAAFLTKMVHHYFKFRYQTAKEALQALSDLTHPRELPKKPAKLSSLTKGEISVLAISMIGCLGGLTYWFYSQKEPNILMIENWGYKITECSPSSASITIDESPYCVQPDKELIEGKKYIYLRDEDQLQQIDEVF